MYESQDDSRAAPPADSGETTDDHDRRERDARTEAVLEAISDKLEQLAEAKLEGMADVDTTLAGLVDSAPPEMKQEIASAFQAKLEALRSELGVSEELSPEQQEILRQVRQHEEQIMAHTLAMESRRRIRGLFLRNPGMLESILSLGDTLRQKGIAAMGIASPGQQPETPVLPNHKDKSQEREL